jgi:hypothetical protein
MHATAECRTTADMIPRETRSLQYYYSEPMMRETVDSVYDVPLCVLRHAVSNIVL